MAPEGEEAVGRFIERFSSALVDAGLPRMPALMFTALLAAEPEGLTADELAGRLQVSRAAISGATGYLEHLGLTARVRQPGSRRARHVLRDPTWYELIARRERVLERWISATREGIDALGVDSPQGRQLTESLEFFEFVHAELPLVLARWREKQARRGLG